MGSLSSPKRPKPKQQLSPLQQKRLVRISAALILLALLWVLFAPGSGVVSLLRKRKELTTLQEKTVQLEQENDKLQQDIDRLQKDSEYLEEIARKDYGLLKKNERVYDFSRKKTEKEEE